MNYSPAQLAQLLDDQKYNVVENDIISFIVKSSQQTNYIKINSPNSILGMNPVAYEQDCINLVGSYATVIVRLFCAPNYIPGNKILDIFLAHKQTLEYVFSLSAWCTTDPIIEQLSLMNILKSVGKRTNAKTRHTLKVLLALYSLGSKHDLPWAELLKFNTSIALVAYLGLLDQSITALCHQRNERLNHLLSSASEFPIINLKDQQEAFSLASPFFNCSYANGNYKYNVKKWITKVLSTNLVTWLSNTSLNYIECLDQAVIKPKPTILVILERYNSTHAMYRCYNNLITNLGQKYRLIAFMEKDDTGLEYKMDAFSEIIYFEPNEKLEVLVEKIRNSTPDLIYYPSIGMATWSICLSTLRLAPIQFMTPGHPSSSYSNEIDYFVVPIFFSTNKLQDFINEKIIINQKTKPTMNYVTRHPELTNDFINENNEYLSIKDEVRIGINGVLKKVSSEVMNICIELSKRSSKKIKFVFFSLYSKYNVTYMSEKIQLQNSSINVELASYSDYLSYMRKLSSCHFLLPTYPFGGSNSNIDAMVLAKPKLFLYQHQELYTRSDEIDWTLVGLQKQFGCKSTEELIDKALTFINDEQALKEASMLMREKCNASIIFQDETNDNGCSINHLIEQMIESHKTSELCAS